MPSSRLIKRTVTEEIYDDRACPVSDIDDEDDAIGDDDDEDDEAIEIQPARGKTKDGPTAHGAETAGTDDSGLTGEEE